MSEAADREWLDIPEGGVDSDESLERGLIREAQRGCHKAFRVLVERHQQRVYHFCFKYLRDVEDAREVCQDTFVKAHRALPRFKPRAKLSSWLFQIALNLCRDRIRSASLRGKKQSFELEDLECGSSGPDEVAMFGADLAKLDRGLAALPENSRSVLVLSCLNGLSHDECAAILKCSERAVEGRLYRARKLLGAWWESQG